VTRIERGSFRNSWRGGCCGRSKNSELCILPSREHRNIVSSPLRTLIIDLLLKESNTRTSYFCKIMPRLVSIYPSISSRICNSKHNSRLFINRMLTLQGKLSQRLVQIRVSKNGWLRKKNDYFINYYHLLSYYSHLYSKVRKEYIIDYHNRILIDFTADSLVLI
jgi:hypothetical protein